MNTIFISLAMLCLAADVHGVGYDTACGSAASGATCDTGFYCDEFLDAPVCAVKVTGDCSNNPKCVTGATCSTNVCTCGGDYTVKGDMCAKKATKACTADADCVTGATCVSSLCACSSDNVQTASLTCPKRATKSCTADADCLPGATCARSKCACSSKHLQTATLTCVGKVGAACDGATDAACTTGAACTNNVCGCVTIAYEEYATDNTCIQKHTVEADCTSAECQVENGECSSNKCKCKSGYTSQTGASFCYKCSASGLVVSLTTLMLAAIAGRMTWA